MNLPFSLNPALEHLPVYQPGRPIEEVAREMRLPVRRIIKLASNENPLGPSPAALAAISRVAAQPDVVALDVNPLIALPAGVTVVDAKVVTAGDGGRAARGDAVRDRQPT